MANTVSFLSYANTFGDWVVNTNALARENNNLATNNYIKSTGTMYLNDPTLGLQVANNAIFAGQLQVQGIGSSASIQNNLSVGGQVYFTSNTLSLTTSGQANIGGPILALSANNGLVVTNNVVVGGTITAGSVRANTFIAVNNLSVTGNIVLSGNTVYGSPTFVLNGNTSIGQNSFLNVNRGASTAASLRWNEATHYWDILDVDNPTSYSKIMTANLISDSLSSASSSTVASSNTVFILNNGLNTTNSNLSANVNSLQSQITSNVNSLNININAVNNYAQSAYALANTAPTKTGVGASGTWNINISGIAANTAQTNFSNVTIGGNQVLHAANFNSYSPTLTGTGATGTWGISIGGNAATTSQTNFSNVTIGGNQVLHAANFNSYSPTLTGGGASGTWGISIGGNAATSSYCNAASAEWYGAAINSSVANGTDTASLQVRNSSGTGDAAVAAMSFLAQGSYGIKLHLRADGYFGLGGWSRGAWSWYSDPSGNMVAAGNITAYSDPRLKKDFAPITDALGIVQKLNGMTFTWKDGIAHTLVKAGKRDYGVLATEVEAVMPEIVTDSIEIDDMVFKTVAYEKIVPVLIEAIKQLKAEIDELKSKSS